MTADEHTAALAEIERLWHAAPGTPEHARLDALAAAVDAYERATVRELSDASLAAWFAEVDAHDAAEAAILAEQDALAEEAAADERAKRGFARDE